MRHKNVGIRGFTGAEGTVDDWFEMGPQNQYHLHVQSDISATLTPNNSRAAPETDELSAVTVLAVFVPDRSSPLLRRRQPPASTSIDIGRDTRRRCSRR